MKHAQTWLRVCWDSVATVPLWPEAQEMHTGALTDERITQGMASALDYFSNSDATSKGGFVRHATHHAPITATLTYVWPEQQGRAKRCRACNATVCPNERTWQSNAQRSYENSIFTAACGLHKHTNDLSFQIPNMCQYACTRTLTCILTSDYLHLGPCTRLLTTLLKQDVQFRSVTT